MAKKKQKEIYNISKVHRILLIICLITIVAFVLFVSIATNGSLAFYTQIHAGLAIAIAAVLFWGKSEVLVYAALVFAVLGAVSALGLIFIYWPYYQGHLEYMRSIQ